MIPEISVLVNWAFASSLLILLVLLLRRTSLTKKLSRTLCYALWLPVLLRLLLPVQLFSVPIYPHIPESSIVGETIVTPDTGSVPPYAAPSTAEGSEGTERVPTIGAAAAPSPASPAAGDEPAASDARSRSELILLVWQSGAVVLAAAIAASNLAFTLKLHRRRVPLMGAPCALPVYTVAGLESPCLAGVLRPAVYLSPAEAEDARHLLHITAHEESHFRGGDHLWSLLRAAALCLHWYNPLVWYAAIASKRDAELACDERTLRRLGGAERAAYGETLLSLTMLRPNAGALLSCSTQMIGDKKTLRERVEGIAHSRQTRAAAAFFVIVVLAFALLLAFGKQQEAGEYDQFIARVEAAGRIAYHPPAYSSSYYPALTDPDRVAEAKELLLQLERADERDIPNDTLDFTVSSGISLDREYAYRFLQTDDATYLYRFEENTVNAKGFEFIPVGKFDSTSIIGHLRELALGQAEPNTSEPNAALYYEVTTEGGSEGVDAISALLLQSDGIRAQWQNTAETLEHFLTIRQGGHRLYYGISSDDMNRSVKPVPRWFVKTANDGSYAIFGVPAELLDELTACFAGYDTNTLRFLTNCRPDDIASAVLTVDGAETALDESLRSDIFFSLSDAAAHEEYFREVTDEGILRGYPVYDFSAALTLTDGTQLTLYPVFTHKGCVLLSLTTDSVDRRFVLEDAGSLYSSLLFAAGLGDVQDEQRDEIYAAASVSGSETDLDFVARSIGEQIAAAWLAVPAETVWKPTDAKLASVNVFDVYYGENGAGRNFCANIGWKLQFDSRFSANYWEAGSGLGEPDADGYYSYGLEFTFAIRADENWHITGIGTGGASVNCGIDLWNFSVFPDCASLVKVFFLTGGNTHDYLIPSHFCDLPAGERTKLGAVLDSYTGAQASDFLRAVADHLAQYPTYHELTAEALYAELPDKYKAFAPVLAAEPLWTGKAGDGRFALYDYGKAEWALLYETGDVRELVTTYRRDLSNPNNSITAFVMDDLLGFPGAAVQSDAVGTHKSYDYYARTDYGVQYVGYSFGFYDTPAECTFSVDFDGDGRSELITDNIYGADGAERVTVFRWNGAASEVGSPDWSKAGVDLSGIGAMNYQESYDAARGVVTLSYRRGEESKTAELPLAPENFMWLVIDELY